MADVLTLDPAYLAKKRNEVKNEISYAKYKVGSSWYRADMVKVEELSDGRIEAIFLIDHTVSGNITVTEIELYDLHDERVARKTVSIQRANAQEGILYVCRFRVFQVTENDKNTGKYDAV